MQMNFSKNNEEHISKAILVGIVTRENNAEEVEKELDGKDFIRTHQSYFVNARKIKSVSKDSAELLNGEILPVSKSKASAVKNAYLWAKR